MPQEQRADGTAGPAGLCDCRAFVPEELEKLRARVAELEAALLLANTRLGDASLAVERAVDGGETEVDVADMADALGLDASANPLGVEDPHDSPLHHPYRLGRDLPAPSTTPIGDPR